MFDNAPVFKSNIKLWVVLAIFAVSLFYFIDGIKGILMPFVSGFIGAYIFAKPTEILTQKGMSRGGATALIILCVIAILVTFGFAALPFLKNEILSLSHNIPEISRKVMASINPILDNIAHKVPNEEIYKIRGQLTNHLGDVAGWFVELLVNLLGNGFAIANIISLVFLTPLIMFYLLKDWPKVTSFINNTLPRLYAKQIKSEFEKIDTVLGAYARGQVIVCLILIVGYSLLLWLIGLSHAFFIGFITGLFAFIPYLGAILGFTCAMAVGLNQFDQLSMYATIMAIFVIMSVIEGYILTPRFIGERIGLHPVWIIFALLSLGNMFGLMGVVFAFPLSAILSTVLKTILSWYREKFVESAEA
jgi:predicted PurR-regulated permease PerM